MPPGHLRKRKSAPKASLPLPHERDQSPQVSARTRAIMRQAKRDLDAGLVDTDNYTRAAAASGAKPQKRRRTPRTT